MTDKQLTDPNILIDDFEQGDNPIMLNDDVMWNSCRFTNLDSTLKITRCKDESFLDNVKKFNKVVAKTHKSSVRSDDEAGGHLHTYGMHRHNGLLEAFVDTKGLKIII